MSFGVTSSGFNRKRVSDIRAELVTDFQTTFGSDIDTSETSNVGALIDMLTKKYAVLWEGLEASYNSRDVNSAEGVSLDRLCAEVGVYRNGATATSVQCVLSGDDGTTIAVGKKVSQDVTQEELSLIEAETITSTACIAADISVDTLTDSVAYTVTIDLNNYTINSGVGATEESIMAALKIDVDSGADPVTFTDNLDGTATITSDDGITTFSISVNSLLDIDELSVLGQFSADNTGAISIPASTINTIVTPVAGWNSVANTQAGVGGNDIETDEELRVRRITALLGVGSGTDSAIQSNIYNEVDFVTSARVISNRTNGTVDSRPAKSYELIVTGGSDLAIAEKLWQVQPAGIESYGNTTQTITDSEGETQTLKFSRPADKYLWIKYTLTLYDEEELTSNPESVIKEAVVDFATEQYLPGVDVLVERLSIPVFDAVTGVAKVATEVAITALPDDTPSWGTADIAISDRETAVVATGRITVLIP